MLLASGAVLCWATVATAFKLALQWQSLFQLLLTAHTTTLVFLGCILALKQQLVPAVTRIASVSQRSLILGIMNPVLYYLVLFKAYQLLPAQVAQPINYTWSLTLVLLSVPLLGHQLTRYDSLALAAAFGGVIMISVGGQASGQTVHLSGIGLALLSTLLWAGYWLANSRDQRSPTIALFQNFLIAWPISTVVFMLFDGNWQWTLKSLSSGIYVGLFEMGISFVLWLMAMRTTHRTALIGNLIFLSPPISLLLIHQVLGEPIGWLTWSGLLVIVLAIVWQQRQPASH